MQSISSTRIRNLMKTCPPTRVSEGVKPLVLNPDVLQEVMRENNSAQFLIHLSEEFQVLLLGLEPTLGSEGVRIAAKDSLVVMRNPAVQPDDGSSLESLSCNYCPAFGDDAPEW
ncbi:hypothetical protein DL767_006916 [Monosporascus sp. MG133]|nr:hypothetical protein DL767_006916 [Monosporascus sp. MG133]